MQPAITEQAGTAPGAAAARRAALDHYRGCLLGGAVGDALGAAVEFDTLDDIRRRFGPRGIEDPAPAFGRAGAITDDTQMTLFTAEALLRAHHRRVEKGRVSVEQVCLHAYWRWLRTQGERPAVPHPSGVGDEGWLFGLRALHERRSPGLTCLSALHTGLTGTPRDPINDSKGCGGLMRIAPVGLAGGDAFDLGQQLAALTHGHPTGYLAAGLFAQLVADLVAGGSLARAVERALELGRATPGGGEVVAALERAVRLAGCSEGTFQDVESLGEGWVAEEALAIAVYCALQARDFAHGVRMAVNHSGDSDSTGSLTGNLLGLVLGERAIPPAWLSALELGGEIGELAHDLWWHFAAEPAAPCGASPDCGQRRKYPGE